MKSLAEPFTRFSAQSLSRRCDVYSRTELAVGGAPPVEAIG
jgi:hypothetical protein